MDNSPQLIDGVAATTLHRDRDEIELSLVHLLQQYLEADSVELLKLVREGTVERAVRRIAAEAHNSGEVEIIRGGATAQDLADHPAWGRCVSQREPQVSTASDGGTETVLPVLDEAGDLTGLMRITSQRALDTREMHLVGGILRIIRNHMALIDYGERDTLTGLLNRKTFEAQFDKLRRELKAGAGPDTAATGNWIGLVDIDRFKSINDGYGHVFGDEVLLLVSQIIQRTFRGADRVYRFGGEEFVVLLQNTTESATAGALERLRSAVEKHRFPQVGSVTISVGWTQIRSQDAPANAIERADAALYHAKGAGRNLVFQYDALVAAGKLEAVTTQNAPEIELF